jgi:glycerol uptake facilitator-like aquaporin
LPRSQQPTSIRTIERQQADRLKTENSPAFYRKWHKLGAIRSCWRIHRALLFGEFTANGNAAHSPGGYSMTACLIAEIVLTFMFLMAILGSTDKRAPQGFAPLAIGLCLALIHMIGIPVSKVSVNPSRSTGPALFVGGWAIQQLWLFWVAPIIGALLAGFIYKSIWQEKT